MHTTFLKFPDQTTCLTKFSEAGMTFTDEETSKEKIIQASHEYAVDEIGTIYTPGEYTTDPKTGEVIEVTPPTPIEGWHVNAIFYNGGVPESLQAYTIEPHPSTPYRLFAGV